MAGKRQKHPATLMGHRTVKLLQVVEETYHPEVPRPPTHLLPSSRQLWREFWSSPLASVVDRQTDMGRIRRWIRYVDEWEQAMQTFQKVRLVRGSTRQLTLNPLAAYLAQCEAAIARAEEQLGLTPLARMRLGIETAKAQNTLEDFRRMLEEPGPNEGWVCGGGD